MFEPINPLFIPIRDLRTKRIRFCLPVCIYVKKGRGVPKIASPEDLKNHPDKCISREDYMTQRIEPWKSLGSKRGDTIIKAKKVEFPTKRAISNEAKELIRRCLTYNQAARPDVLTMAHDPNLSYSKK